VKLHFAKMSGAGNDFVVIDNRSNVVVDGETLAKKLCDRRWGIGADGLLLLQAATDADYRMMYYNADGSYGGMCGNGGRCIARYAVEAGIAGGTHSFDALGYHYKSIVTPDEVILSMMDPSEIRMNVVLHVGSLSLKVHFINTGSPHVVIPVSQLAQKYSKLENVPVAELGKKIRNHQAFEPDGTNVNFVEKKKGNMINIRTYERGVESETLACGTGSIASAIVGSKLWKMTPPVTIVPSSGVSLEVGFDRIGSNFTNVTLKGQAIETFRGEIDV
jgi:diaminopimelate epimerase